MPLKKTNRMAFSNGTEYMWFEDMNCNKCVKSSRYNEDKESFTNYRCAIQRDIQMQYVLDCEISERTYNICLKFIIEGVKCPYIKTKRKKYNKRKVEPNQLRLL